MRLFSRLLLFSGSETEGTIFLPFSVPFSFNLDAEDGRFGCTSPVLFLLCDGATFKLTTVFVAFTLDLLELILLCVAPCIRLFMEEIVSDVLEVRANPLGFTTFDDFLGISAEESTSCTEEVNG